MSKSNEPDVVDSIDELNPRKLVIFGKDVSKVPCFRNSFLYGIGSGIGLGILWFGLTSRVQQATKVGFYFYVAFTGSYWTICRYNYSKTKFEYQRLQHDMQHYVENVGVIDEQQKPIDNIDIDSNSNKSSSTS